MMVLFLIQAALACPSAGGVTLDGCTMPSPLDADATCLVSVLLGKDGERTDEVETCDDAASTPTAEAVRSWSIVADSPPLRVGLLFRFRDGVVAVEAVRDPGNERPPMPPADLRMGGVIGGVIGGTRVVHHSELKPKSTPDPELPGLEAFRCRVELVVDSKGNIRSVEPEPKCPEAAHDTLVAVMKTWVFKPVKVDGEKQTVKVSWPIEAGG